MRHLVLLLAACGIAQLTCSRIDAQGVTPTLPAAKADVANAGSADDVDPYQWLEDVDSARAMAWVNAENAKTSRKRHWAFMAELQNLRMTGKLLDDYERILT